MADDVGSELGSGTKLSIVGTDSAFYLAYVDTANKIKLVNVLDDKWEPYFSSFTSKGVVQEIELNVNGEVPYLAYTTKLDDGDHFIVMKLNELQ